MNTPIKPHTRITVYVPKDEYLQLRSILIQKEMTVSAFFREKARELIKKYTP